MSARPFDAVLFDMDGTLLDTAPDIGAALNEALAADGLAGFELADIAMMIGHGPRMLVERALARRGVAGITSVDATLARYIARYAERDGRATRVFDGAQPCLAELAARGLRLAVVTNALQSVAERLLVRFALDRHLDLVLGGDRVARGKPHPEPLLAACTALGVPPQATLFIGDSPVDVAAARAAGCAMVAVPHGYTGGLTPETLGCSLVDSLGVLPAWIDVRSARMNDTPALLSTD
jgi:phosphoglycolate phosphatase